MKILDLSAGRRNIWYDKRHPDATFIDIRPEVEPDVVADSRDLSFLTAGTYDLVVFDPPHTTFGPNAQMAKRYGSHKAADIRELVLHTSREIARVLKPEGLVAFKWSDHGHQSLEKMLALMPHLEPLFGHIVSRVQTGHLSTTQWVMLRRRSDMAYAEEIWRQYQKAS